MNRTLDVLDTNHDLLRHDRGFDFRFLWDDLILDHRVSPPKVNEDEPVTRYSTRYAGPRGYLPANFMQSLQPTLGGMGSRRASRKARSPFRIHTGTSTQRKDIARLPPKGGFVTLRENK